MFQENGQSGESVKILIHDVDYPGGENGFPYEEDVTGLLVGTL